MGSTRGRTRGPGVVPSRTEGHNSTAARAGPKFVSKLDKMIGLSSVVLFSPDPGRSKPFVIGAVLASDSFGFLESRFQIRLSLLPTVHRPVVSSLAKELGTRFSITAVKSSGRSPEDLLREAWHDLGDSVFLTEPEVCRFSNAEDFLDRYLLSAINGR